MIKSNSNSQLLKKRMSVFFIFALIFSIVTSNAFAEAKTEQGKFTLEVKDIRATVTDEMILTIDNSPPEATFFKGWGTAPGLVMT